MLKMRDYAISLRPLLSSKSFKNDSNYEHSWSCGFLSWSISIDFSSKTPVIISILGVPDFWLNDLIFIILHISIEILKLCYVHRFFDFVNISELFRFVVFPMENLTFWYFHGFVISDHISCYHQNCSKTTVIINILGVVDFGLGASTSFFLQKHQ